MSLPLSIRSIWQQVKHRYEARANDAPPSTEEEIISAETALREYYAEHVKASVAFEFPTELKEFLTVVGPERNCAGSYGSGAYGFYWYAPETIVSDTKYSTDVWWDQYKTKLGLWACIAHWSDKHDTWICCTPKHKQFGHIVDCHDGHPWVDQDKEANSLGEFLLSWGRWHDPQ
jgi:hypothetical protein